MQNSSSTLALLPVPHAGPAVLLACLGVPCAQQRWNSVTKLRDETSAALFSPLLENCLFVPLLPSSSEQATTCHYLLYTTMNKQDATTWRMVDAAIQACWAMKNIIFSTPKHHMNKIMSVQIKDLDFCISIGLQNHLPYLASDNQVLEKLKLFIYIHC